MGGRDLMIRNFKVSALSCAHETLPTGDDVVSTVDPALVRTSSFYAYGFPPNPPGCNLFRGEREAFAHAVTYTVNRTSGHRRKESDITNLTNNDSGTLQLWDYLSDFNGMYNVVLSTPNESISHSILLLRRPFGNCYLGKITVNVVISKVHTDAEAGWYLAVILKAI